MAQYFDDFGAHSVGDTVSNMSGWTARTGSPANEVVSDSSYTAGQGWLIQGSDFNWDTASFDSANNTSDVEIFVQIEELADGEEARCAASRITGSAADRNAYWGEFQRSGVNSFDFLIRKYADDSISTLSETDATDLSLPMNIRFRVNGTDLKLRYWEDGSPEPGTWDLETTDPDHSSGYHGVANWADTYEIDVFGIGTNGDSAPTEPVSAGEDVSISVPSASATGDGATPAVSTQQQPTVSVPTADASATALAPSVDTGVSVSVSVPVASGASTAATPGIDTQLQPTVSIPTASASGTAPTPSVTTEGGATVAVPTATAGASGIEPTVTTELHPTINIPAAAGGAKAPPPALATADTTTVSVPVASAASAGPTPSVAGELHPTIGVPVATAAAEAAAPAISTVLAPTVSVPTASATATGVVPDVFSDVTAVDETFIRMLVWHETDTRDLQLHEHKSIEADL